MRYIQNENKIIAIMENTAFDAVEFLRANCPGVFARRFAFFNPIGEKEYLCSCETLNERELDSLLLKNNYVGIAKCNPVDEFDEELGKKIAASRAKAKHDKAMYKKVRKMIDAEKKTLERASTKMQYKYQKSMKDNK